MSNMKLFSKTFFVSLCLHSFVLIFSDQPTYEFIPETSVRDSHISTNYWDCKKGPRVYNDDTQYVAVYLDDSWDFGEDVYLPHKTDIIFGENGILFGSGSGNDVECDESMIRESSEKYWHDPYNWKRLDNNNSTFLHAQMVPDEFEVALFRPDAAYYVTINVPFLVGGIYISDYPHSSESLLMHMETFEGRLQFRTGVTLTKEITLTKENIFNLLAPVTKVIGITDFECTDVQGCINANIVGEKIINEICSQIRMHKFGCPFDYICRYPVQPRGHCCRLCGSIIMFKFNDRFIVQPLYDLQTRTMRENNFIRISVLKITPTDFQIVIILNNTDAYDYDQLEPVVYSFTNALEKNIAGIEPGSLTMAMSENFSAVDTAALVLTLLCVFCLLFGLGYAVLRKRATVLKWIRSERLTMRAVWKEKSEDEMFFELSEPSTSTARKSGGRSILSSYKQLLKKDNTDAGRYKKMKVERSFTVDNPVFETKCDEN